MRPHERLLQRQEVKAGAAPAPAKAAQQAAPNVQESFRARLNVEKVAERPSQAAAVNVRDASSVFVTSGNSQALRDHTMGVGRQPAASQAPRGPTAQQAAGRPADRLVARQEAKAAQNGPAIQEMKARQQQQTRQGGRGMG